MLIEIDENSGFCFGVVTAIKKAEEELKNGPLFSLGDIVHNNVEVSRLEQLGLQTIDHSDLKRMRGNRVLLRAHGEPPSTYAIAQANGIELIDASCPVVLGLQRKIKEAYLSCKAEGGTIVIYGKRGHAEVIGLVGQTNNEAIVIERPEELSDFVFKGKLFLFSQTTQSLTIFKEIATLLKQQKSLEVVVYDTICRKVANRIPNLKDFAKRHDVIIFVSGKKSSNGKQLYKVSKMENPRTFFVQDETDLFYSSFADAQSIGITGATSTPRWLMERIKEQLDIHFNSPRN